MNVEALSRAVVHFRKVAPKPLRQLYRVIRLASTSPRHSVAIPQELLDNCQMCSSRKTLVARLPRHGVVAEIGTARGRFSKYILDTNDPSELHLVDLDMSQLNPSIAADSRIRIYRGYSHAVISTFPDIYFDWIYIDADHSYKAVCRDIEAAASKIKPLGFLVFDDFAYLDLRLGSYGVQRAVIEFAVAQRWEFAWFAFERNGTYNVGIRRPGRATNFDENSN